MIRVFTDTGMRLGEVLPLRRAAAGRGLDLKRPIHSVLWTFGQRSLSKAVTW